MIFRWLALTTTMLLMAPAPETGEWEGLVKKYVEAYDSVKEPVPTAYPWMARRLRTLFEVEGVGHIQCFSEVDGKRRLGADIYYKVGEVRYINHVEGWNLITKGQEAYEWKTGQQEGLITKLDDKDLIDYLIYMTDPSFIMTCLYHDALEEPDKFLPEKEVEPGCVERRLKKPVEGFRAVFVSKEPAWLCGFESVDQDGGKPTRLIWSKPESIKAVPASVLDRIKGVEFKKSDLSIRRHLVYL